MLNLIKSRKNKEGGSKGNKRSGSKSEKNGRNRNEKNRNVDKGYNVSISTTPSVNVSTSSGGISSGSILNDSTVQQLYEHYYSIAEVNDPGIEPKLIEENTHTLQSESHLLPTTRSTNPIEDIGNSSEVPIDLGLSTSINESKEQSVSIQKKTGNKSNHSQANERKTGEENKLGYPLPGHSIDNNSNIMQDPMERPSSRSSMVGVSKRSNQPKLGTGGGISPGSKNWSQQPHNTYLFEDDPGIMSEVETSSSRLRKTSSSRDSKHSVTMNNSGPSMNNRNHIVPGQRHPRTSPNQYTHLAGQNYPMAYLSANQSMFNDDDPGIMSEAETSSTTRGGSKRGSISNTGNNQRGRVSIPSMGSNSLSISGKNSNSQPRSVQFRYPIVSHQYPGNSGSHNHAGNSNLFEEDPGIMSEAETSSTPGRRRGQLLRGNNNGSGLGYPKNRMNAVAKHDSDVLPVVRTPSKTLERPLGIVFLIHRGETKRALLPNEITSIITVKALFVRSFGSGPSRLTMEYMDTPRVKIYVHDGSKDVFYEINDVSDVRDKTILKLFEADSSGKGPAGLGASGLPPITNNGDEEILAAVGGVTANSTPILPAAAPEAEYVDSRSVRALKIFNRNNKQDQSGYGMAPRPSSAMSNTLPRNAFSTLGDVDPSRSSTSMGMDSVDAYSQITSNVVASGGLQQQSLVPGGGRLGERSKTLGPGFLRSGTEGSIVYNRLTGNQNILNSYYVTPGMDGNESYNNTQDAMNSYGHQQHTQIRSRFSNLSESNRYYTGPGSTEEAKERMMNMEAQLSQLTGMVEKALKHKRLSGKKTVSFDKAVSFSDDKPEKSQPQGILTNSSHSRHHKNDRRSSDGGGVRDHHSHHHHLQSSSKSSIISSSSSPTPRMMSPELYNQLRGLQRSAKDLRQEVKVLRRLTQLQSMAMKDLVQDTYLKLREACIAFSVTQQTGKSSLTGGTGAMSASDLEQWRLAQDEEIFSRELNELVQAISQLEAKVEEMRSGVINKKNKIGLADVENMALILSKSTKTVTQLKQVFPTLEANLRGSAAFQSGTSTSSKGKPASVLLTEEFLRRTPERLENVWKRCKKLTGTLVTLKRLASVQEQRFHPGSSAIVDVNVSLSPTPPIDMGRMSSAGTGSNQNSLKSSSSSTSSSSLSTSTQSSATMQVITDRKITDQREGTLDDLLDALQNYSMPNKISSSEASKRVPDGRDKQVSNTPSSQSKLIPSANLDRDNLASSPLKKGIGDDSLQKGASKGTIGTGLDSQLKPKERLGSAETQGKLKTNGPIQNIALSPSIKMTGGSSSTTKTAPPPPPPRTSSTQPVASTGALDSINNEGGHVHGMVRKMSSKINSMNSCGRESGGESSDFSESSESINSQEGHGYVGNSNFIHNSRKIAPSSTMLENPPPIPNKPSDIHGLSGKLRQDALETRHQELLTRQKQLQEQYERLQHMAQQKKGEKNTIPSSSALVGSVASTSLPKNTAKISANNDVIASQVGNMMQNPSLVNSGFGQSSSSLSSSSSSSLSRNEDLATKVNHTNNLQTGGLSSASMKAKEIAVNNKNILAIQKSTPNVTATISTLSAKKISASAESDRGNLGSSGNETEESSNPEEDNSDAGPTCKKMPEITLGKNVNSNKVPLTSSSTQIVKKKIPPALPARGSSVITTVPSASPKNNIPIPSSAHARDENNKNTAASDADKKKCDTKQPNSEESIDRGSSQADGKEVGDSSVDSFDGSNATLKKSYETDMI